jgi:hypothetical protein
VRDWLNEHPFKNELDARLICNLYNGGAINPEALWTMMKQLRKRIIRLLEDGSITDEDEGSRLEFILKTKRWNPYCIRHSAITSDSDYLTSDGLNKKVRWSMNTRQRARYIKRRMGNGLKEQILVHDGKSRLVLSECSRRDKGDFRAMTDTDINVGEEAIRRLAEQVFDAPKDRKKARESVAGNVDGNGADKKKYQEHQGQNRKDSEKQKEKRPVYVRKYHDGDLLAEAIVVGQKSYFAVATPAMGDTQQVTRINFHR